MPVKVDSCFNSLLLLVLFVNKCRAQICSAGGDIQSCGVGTCITLVLGYNACLCPFGYSPDGPTTSKCAEIDVCTSPYTLNRVCFNGATCQSVPGRPGEYTCICPPGFGGTHCQRSENACDRADTCLNAGQCIVDATQSSGFRCNCLPNFEGSRCESQRYIGVGGAGTQLNPIQLVFLWGLWIAMAITFLYCGVNMLIDWWCRRFRKAITGGS